MGAGMGNVRPVALLTSDGCRLTTHCPSPVHFRNGLLPFRPTRFATRNEDSLMEAALLEAPLTRKPTREELKPGEVLCDHCTAKCCRYFALPLDTPKTQRDFDFIRWYL